MCWTLSSAFMKEKARFPIHNSMERGIVITIMMMGSAVFHLELDPSMIPGEEIGT